MSSLLMFESEEDLGIKAMSEGLLPFLFLGKVLFFLCLY